MPAAASFEVRRTIRLGMASTTRTGAPVTIEAFAREMIQEETPCDVQELLEQQGLNGEPVLLSTSSDLGLRGEPRRQWLVVTRSNVSVVADGAAPEVVHHVPLNRIEKFRSHSAIGSGFLQAYVDGAWIDVVRHSNSLSWRFHQVAGRLEGLRTTGEVAATNDADADQLRCTTCNRRLSAKGEPCPRCLPRKAIAARLWQIMRPQWPTALAMSALMVVGVAMNLAPPKLREYPVDDILAGGQIALKRVHPGDRPCCSLGTRARGNSRVLLGVVNWGSLRQCVGVQLTLTCGQNPHKRMLGVGYYVDCDQSPFARQPCCLRTAAAVRCWARHRRLPAADRADRRRRRDAVYV
ncbi:MAG: hypothetical protein U0992_13080 [Planctomycetaceae bacterium]